MWIQFVNDVMLGIRLLTATAMVAAPLGEDGRYRNAPHIAKFAPELANTQYGEEIWTLYEDGGLHLDVALTGRFDRKLGRWIWRA